MRAILVFVAIWAGLGVGAWVLGQEGARAYERILGTRVQAGLAAARLGWAEVAVSGREVTLSGHAPDLFAQELAVETVAAVAPLARLVNLTSADLPPPPPRAPLHIELVREGSSARIVGQASDAAMRESIAAQVAETLPELDVQNLLGTRGQPVPVGWGPEVAHGLMALALLDEVRVAIAPGAVEIHGRAPTHAARAALVRRLERAVPPQLAVTIEIEVPRPLVTPYRFTALRLAEGRLKIERCVARDEAEAVAIAGAVTRHGGRDAWQGCPVGIGAPTADWAAAVVAGIGALAELPAGRVDITYRDILLSASGPGAEPALERALASLAMALPEGYVADGDIVPLEAEGAPPATRPRHWLRLARDEEGLALDGHMPNEAALVALRTLAAAKFGSRIKATGLQVRRGLTARGWEAAARAGLDALRTLDTGTVLVTPTRILMRGQAPSPQAVGQIERMVRAALPQLDIDLAIGLTPPPEPEPESLEPEACLAMLNDLMRSRPIGFAPGSAVIDPSGPNTISRIVAILSDCPEVPIEIGGHTDSRGSADLNARLSQARAEAVRDRLIAEGVASARVVARGYGETRPIANNDTEAGRAENRRIAFEIRESAE